MKISQLLTKEEFKELFLNNNFPSVFIESTYCKQISDLHTLFNSNTYNSDFIKINNNSYKLLLYILCNAVDIYCTHICTKTTKSFKNYPEFVDIFEWFFNDKYISYIGNFSFICEQLNINKKSILRFLIHITKNNFILIKRN